MAEAAPAAPAAAEAGPAKKQWLPLESNPETLGSYVRNLGCPEHVTFQDVLALDDWALEMVQGQTLAVMLLFPITDASRAAKAEQAANLPPPPPQDAGVYFMRQRTGNACGTIGLLHAFGNLSEAVPLAEDSWMGSFFARTRGQTPEEIALALDADERLERAHQAAATQGQSQVVERVALHFISFVPVGGVLYEFDGGKTQPIAHGPTSPATVLADAAAVIRREFMEKDPESVRFGIIAMGVPSSSGGLEGAGAPAEASCPICGVEGDEVAIQMHVEQCLAAMSMSEPGEGAPGPVEGAADPVEGAADPVEGAAESSEASE